MKRTKKLLALVLAMVMAFSLMAVTAAADTEEHEHAGACSTETVQRRLPKMWCENCRVTMNTSAPYYDEEGRHVVDFVCPICGDCIEGVPY